MNITYTYKTILLYNIVVMNRRLIFETLYNQNFILATYMYILII